MVKSTDKKTAIEIELSPKAWALFERAVDVVAKSPPQHRLKTDHKRKRVAVKRRKAKSHP
jgi:hypothetical protein